MTALRHRKVSHVMPHLEQKGQTISQSLLFIFIGDLLAIRMGHGQQSLDYSKLLTLASL